MHEHIALLFRNKLDTLATFGYKTDIPKGVIPMSHWIAFIAVFYRPELFEHAKALSFKSHAYVSYFTGSSELVKLTNSASKKHATLYWLLA